jgi:hypothetical protein
MACRDTGEARPGRAGNNKGAIMNTTTASSSVPAAPDPGYRDAIIRAANDPAFDINKFERLLAAQEAMQTRASDLQFNVALAAAQADMKQVSTDATNPQTRSKYATYGALDRMVRPIYTRHGFSVSYTTEPTGEPNTILVVGMLANGPISRRYQMPIPIDTKGPKGADHMTRTHATMSATTYGKRGLLTMMFNLATDDDDGNFAGGRGRPVLDVPRKPAPPPPVPEDHYAVHVDEATGEQREEVTPFEVDWLEADVPRSWGEKLIACVRAYCRARDEVDGFMHVNADKLERMKGLSPGTHDQLLRSIFDIRRALKD